MKLFYAPGACSLSPHIALIETGLRFDAIKADLATKVAADGSDLTRFNPKGQVPTLVLDDGTVLTEGPAIVQWIADQVPSSGLAPPAGTAARYRLIEWLNFLTSEIHKGFSPLFNRALDDSARTIFRDLLAHKFDWLERELSGRPYLMDSGFTVADGYLYTLLGWTKMVKIDLERWPALAAYRKRIAERPSVHRAMVAEGLVKA